MATLLNILLSKWNFFINSLTCNQGAVTPFSFIYRTYSSNAEKLWFDMKHIHIYVAGICSDPLKIRASHAKLSKLENIKMEIFFSGF